MKSACPVPIGCLVFLAFSFLDIQSYLLRFKVMFLGIFCGVQIPRHLGCWFFAYWDSHRIWNLLVSKIFETNFWQRNEYKKCTDHLFRFSSPSTGQSLGTIAGLQLAVEDHTCVDGRKLTNIFWVVLNLNPALVGWNLPWRRSTCRSGMFESSVISFKP